MSAHLHQRMKNLNDMTDEELALSYVKGDNQAFNLLLTRNEVRLFSYIMLVVRNEDMANDIFQETFVRVITQLQERRYVPNGKFYAWCVRIAHNVIIDRYRNLRLSNVVEPFGVNDLDNLVENSILMGNTEDHFVRSQILQDVRRLVDRLPELQREVVYMRYFQKLSFKEIAELTHVNINTSLARMRYALLNLRKMVRKYDLFMRIDD